MWKLEQYCEYFITLKCFCIFIKPNFSKRGIQQMIISLKKPKNNFKEVKFAVIPPGKFYSRQRQRSRIAAGKGFEYDYNIDYSINQAISKTSSPCFHHSNWMLDKCKLKYLTNLLLSQYNCTAPWLLAFAR